MKPVFTLGSAALYVTDDDAGGTLALMFFFWMCVSKMRLWCVYREKGAMGRDCYRFSYWDLCVLSVAVTFGKLQSSPNVGVACSVTCPVSVAGICLWEVLNSWGVLWCFAKSLALGSRV